VILVATTAPPCWESWKSRTLSRYWIMGNRQSQVLVWFARVLDVYLLYVACKDDILHITESICDTVGDD